MEAIDYAKIANDARKKVLDLIFKAQVSHIGSNFSVAEIMTCLFNRIDFEKDRFLAGKSWAAAMVYYHLWRRGRITENQPNSFCKEGSPFIGLVEPVTSDLIFGVGSMGFCLPAGCGFALSKKYKDEAGRIYVLESDGGMQEGSNWEAFMFAAHHKLNNLCVVVDRNGFCAMGETNKISNQKFLPKVLKDMGWSVAVIDGHDFKQINQALDVIDKKPRCIIADTIKGKGWKRAEGNNLYHYKQLSSDERDEALKDILGIPVWAK